MWLILTQPVFKLNTTQYNEELPHGHAMRSCDDFRDTSYIQILLKQSLMALQEDEKLKQREE
jgi:hypothetical protein